MFQTLVRNEMILLERYLRLFLYGTALDNFFCLALDISNKRLS